MCGIVGTLNLTRAYPIDEHLLLEMLAMIRHRGPDQLGIYRDNQVGLGNARLSIIDLEGGQQPISNEDETVWIVFNGEIFNYIELRPGLEAKGHRFATASDTEVIVHLYEEYGPACLEHLNGQFALAIWDKRSGELMLARDRLGIRPLFYTVTEGALIFGSEIKAILVDPRVRADIDPLSLDQVFTFWTTVSPRTIFQDILEVPPGHFLVAQGGGVRAQRYWGLTFPEDGAVGQESEEYYAERLRELLVDAIRLRLRADVPVGAYLSGGLDSSTITTLIRDHTSNYLRTFSIAFSDPDFDERGFQEAMVAFLGTDHSRVECTQADIGRVFPQVIWHTEMPILRTSPAPMYLLSRLVHENGFKVVLTGEGADEFLAGYNIFKEAKVRHFWARQPDSRIRPLLLRKLYPYIPQLSERGGTYLEAFFKAGLTEVEDPTYSHAVRWRNTAALKKLFSSEMQAAVSGHDPVSALRQELNSAFRRWAPLSQAQYIEITVFMSEYLLSSQGDRMLMAHSVEGRFPFLDHRVVEFCNHIPPRFKLRGLDEKHILKQSMRGLLPAEACLRPKQPYRAPIQRSFFPSQISNLKSQISNDPDLDYVEELLSPEAIAASGYFDADAVSRLVGKCQRGMRLSERDNMALAGVLSTQLVHRLFVEDFTPRPVVDTGDVKHCVRKDIGS
ncbi:MAG: asparagine synthase (glutamine-hydrolyzing) [Anaerolineae bacterium]|nr:asparagine synthase (glutamine-hydrolyzing) [Anaerolineae bacterium]